MLSRVPLFSGMTDNDMYTLLECLKPRIASYKKGEFIAHAGDEMEGIGIMLAGSASVIKENAVGNRVIMAILEPGDMFGEMAAFSKDARWPASVIAQEACTAAFMPPGKIVGNCEKTCGNHNRLIVNMLGILSEKALLLNRKVNYLTIKSMRGKISAFLLEQYEKNRSASFIIPMSRSELSDFLNVSRPSMCREMGRMRDEGIVEFYRSAVRIKDLTSLAESAGQ